MVLLSRNISEPDKPNQNQKTWKNGKKYFQIWTRLHRLGNVKPSKSKQYKLD